MKKFEYKVVDIAYASINNAADEKTMLDAEGASGWELVNVVHYTDTLGAANSFRYFFKRATA